MSLLTGKQKDKWLYKIHIVSELTTNIGKGNKKLPKVSQKTLLVREKWERSDHFASKNKNTQILVTIGKFMIFHIEGYSVK